MLHVNPPIICVTIDIILEVSYADQRSFWEKMFRVMFSENGNSDDTWCFLIQSTPIKVTSEYQQSISITS